LPIYQRPLEAILGLKLTETVDDGDTDSSLLTTGEHGHHPAQEQGDGRPDTGAAEANEGVSDGIVAGGRADDERGGSHRTSGEQVPSLLARSVRAPTEEQSKEQGDEVDGDGHDCYQRHIQCK
jgi:hypothetical protein